MPGGSIEFVAVGATLTVEPDRKPITLKGVNWFGAESALDRAPFGLDKHDVAWYGTFLHRHGFNAVRLFFNHAAVLQNQKMEHVTSGGDEHIDAERTLLGLTYVEMLLSIATALSHHGIVVTLVAHRLAPEMAPGAPKSGVWFNDDVPLDMVKYSWSRLCRTMCQTNVVAVDLFNEPFASDWGSGDPKTDWRLGAEDLGNHVLASCPQWLILVEGVGDKPGALGLPRGENGNHFWGENLNGARYRPIRLSRQEKLVYSPHVYGPDFGPQHGVPSLPWFGGVQFWNNQIGWTWEQHFGFLTGEGGGGGAKKKEEDSGEDTGGGGGPAIGTPIVIGELGGFYTTKEDMHWQDWALGYAAARGFSLFYFALNPNSDDTGGILLDDWTTPHEGKLKALEVLPSSDFCKMGYMSLHKAPPAQT